MAQRGLHGNRLEVVRIGGTTYTSREALQRFASPPDAPFTPTTPNSPARQQQIDRAVHRLDEFLYGGKSHSTGRSDVTRADRNGKTPNE